MDSGRPTAANPIGRPLSDREIDEGKTSTEAIRSHEGRPSDVNHHFDHDDPRRWPAGPPGPPAPKLGERAPARRADPRSVAANAHTLIDRLAPSPPDS